MKVTIARYNIWTVPELTVKKFNSRSNVKFESVSATGAANNIVIHPLPFSKRIAKELPSAQYLDCELRSSL